MNSDDDIRDATLDALLDGHATETPPAHVDAAILAAAHRAVAAAPHAAASARATQTWRWWMPLAAAAVIGVIVVGIMPLAPTLVEETAPVSDSPASAPPLRPRSDTSSTVAVPGDKAAIAIEPGAEPPRQVAEPSHAAAKRERGNAAPPAPKTTASGARKERAPMSEAPTNDASRELELERDATAAAAAVEMRKDQSGALGASPQTGTHRASPPAATTMPRDAPESPQLASPPEGSAQQDAPYRDKRDDFSTRPRLPEEWIVRIRMLRSEGRLTEAIRTLAGFRAAFPDADTRLPADLREWVNALR